MIIINIVLLVLGLVLARFFPRFQRLLITLFIALIVGLWLVRAGFVYWTLHSLARHNVKTVAIDTGNLSPLHRGNVQAALRKLDRHTLLRLPLLPIATTDVTRTRILVSLPLFFYEWNQDDYDMWMHCYKNNTSETYLHLLKWEAKIRSGTRDATHAPLIPGINVPLSADPSLCPSQTDSHLTQTEIYAGKAGSPETKIPYKGDKTYGSWDLKAVHDAGQLAIIRCEYSDGTIKDVELTKKPSRCFYMDDPAFATTVRCL